MALLSNEVQVIDGVALSMHCLQAAPVPVLTLHRTKPVPLFPITVAPAVVVSTVILPAGEPPFSSFTCQAIVWRWLLATLPVVM